MNKTIAVCDGCGATLETGILIRLDICATWRACGDPIVRHLVDVTENPRSMVKSREVHFCNPECAKTFLTTALLDTHVIKDPTGAGHENDAQQYAMSDVQEQILRQAWDPIRSGFGTKLKPGVVFNASALKGVTP